MRLSERVKAVELCLQQIAVFARDHQHNLSSLHDQLVFLRKQMRSLAAVLVDVDQVQMIKDILLHLQRYINIVRQSEKYAAVINREVDSWFSQINTDVGKLLCGLRDMLITSDPEIPDFNPVPLNPHTGSSSPKTSLSHELKSVLSSLSFGLSAPTGVGVRDDLSSGPVAFDSSIVSSRRLSSEDLAALKKTVLERAITLKAAPVSHVIAGASVNPKNHDTLYSDYHGGGGGGVGPSTNSESRATVRRQSAVRLSPIQVLEEDLNDPSGINREPLLRSGGKRCNVSDTSEVRSDGSSACVEKNTDVVSRGVVDTISGMAAGFVKPNNPRSNPGVGEKHENKTFELKVKPKSNGLISRSKGGLQSARNLFSGVSSRSVERRSLRLTSGALRNSVSVHEPNKEVVGRQYHQDESSVSSDGSVLSRDFRKEMTGRQTQHDKSSVSSGGSVSPRDSDKEIVGRPYQQDELNSSLLAKSPSNVGRGHQAEVASFDSGPLGSRKRRPSWYQRAHDAVIDWHEPEGNQGASLKNENKQLLKRRSSENSPDGLVSRQSGVRPPVWLKREAVEILGEYHYTKTPVCQLDQLVILLHDSSYGRHASLSHLAVPGGVAQFVIKDAQNLDLFILNLKGVLCNPACLLTNPAKTRVIHQMDEIYDKLRSGYCTRCELDLVDIFKKMDEPIFQQTRGDIFTTVLLKRFLEEHYVALEKKIRIDAIGYKKSDHLLDALKSLYHQIEMLRCSFEAKGLHPFGRDNAVMLKQLPESDIKKIIRDSYAVEENILSIASNHSEFALQAACYRYYYVVPVLESVVRLQERKKHDPLYADVFGLRAMATRLGQAKNIALFFRFVYQSLPSKEMLLGEKHHQVSQLKALAQSKQGSQVVSGVSLFAQLKHHPGVKKQGFGRLVNTVSGRRYLLLKAAQSHRPVVAGCW